MAEATLGGPGGDSFGLGAALGAEPVVDRRDRDRHPARRRETCRKAHERDRVGAAGNGKDHRARTGLPLQEIGLEKRRDIRMGERLRLAGHAQRARFCSRSAPWRTLAASGYFRPSSAKVAQAWSRAPSAFSAMPSLSIASGALFERACSVETLRNCSAASRGRLRW